MTGSVNKVALLGNVGRDPEVRQTQKGTKIVNLSLATSETWKDKSGERQERTEWHRISIFNENIARVVEKYVTKGSKLYIEGSIQSRKYTDRDGAERTTVEIVIGPYNGQLVLLDGNKQPMKRGYSEAQKPNDDDELPF